VPEVVLKTLTDFLKKGMVIPASTALDGECAQQQQHHQEIRQVASFLSLIMYSN
jgi:hypothetical protein